jgi:hypothetical protein
VRRDEGRRHHDDDRLRGFDPCLDPRAPVRALRDVLEIDPQVLAIRGKRSDEPLDELAVAARVGDERVRPLRLRARHR